MKKLFTVISLAALIFSMTAFFTGCGAKDETVTTENTTEAALTEDTTERTSNEGMVTDESEPGDDGAVGDAVTDISEGVSDIVTDISEDVQR